MVGQRLRGPPVRKRGQALGGGTTADASGASLYDALQVRRGPRQPQVVEIMSNDPAPETRLDKVGDTCEEAPTDRLIERQNVREGTKKVAVLGSAVLSVA